MRTLPMCSVGTKPGSSTRSPTTPKAFSPAAGFIGHDHKQRPADRLRRRTSDKELAIEAAKLFQSLECGDQDALGTVDLPEGQRPGASLAGLELEAEQRAEIAELRGEVADDKPSAAAGSAKAGPPPLESTPLESSMQIVCILLHSLIWVCPQFFLQKTATLGGCPLLIYPIGTP